MNYGTPPIINMAIVGGHSYCTELLERTSFSYEQDGVNTPILAVADADPQAPGMIRANQLGLLTFADYHDLYDRRYNIHLIIILTPEEEVLQDILATRPPRIRILSYHVFEIFWRAIGQEERKQRQQREAMETIINGIRDFIMVITPDLRVEEVNAVFLEKMGITREQVIGRTCQQVLYPAESDCNNAEMICPMQDVVRNKLPTRQVRMRQGSDGAMRWFEVKIFPVWEKSGKISKFIHISHDITERKREEDEIKRRLEKMVEERTRQLRETHNKLLHQDKMASLGKLSASVVHEINNPIAGILNLIMLIKRILDEGALQSADIDNFSQYINLVETETRRISQIVSNLLAFSRQSKLAFKPVNIARLIDKTLLLNANLLKINGVKVEMHIDPDLPDISASENQLQQVFMNIVSNAGEAMEPTGGGRLTVKAHYLAKEDHVLISFSDSGVGISPKAIPKLFEPFFTTKKESKGVGLGLSVAYGIIQEHGGSIYVDSEEGRGATFKVKLPLKAPAAAADDEQQRAYSS